VTNPDGHEVLDFGPSQLDDTDEVPSRSGRPAWQLVAGALAAGLVGAAIGWQARDSQDTVADDPSVLIGGAVQAVNPQTRVPWVRVALINAGATDLRVTDVRLVGWEALRNAERDTRLRLAGNVRVLVWAAPDCGRDPAAEHLIDVDVSTANGAEHTVTISPSGTELLNQMRAAWCGHKE